MQFGFNLPLSGPSASPAMLARLAAEGEAIGYDYAAISDHIVEPIDIHARYPYSESGEFPAGSRGERHEQLTAIAYLAAKTSRLKFLTSVMVVPHRPAVLTAKILATIDVMSGGRLIVGVGAGWLEEEFVAIGAPPFAERGTATDEYLMAFRELWTKDKPRFDGRFVKFSDILFAPKPVQKPCPALWIGGESGPAMRRAARIGDGWYPIGANPQHRLDTMARYRAAVERLHGIRLLGVAGPIIEDVAIGWITPEQRGVAQPIVQPRAPCRRPPGSLGRMAFSGRRFADYSKRSFESGTKTMENLLGAKSLDKAFEVQSEYARAAYEDYVSCATRLGALYTDLAKEAFKPYQSFVARATPGK
jgi:probable F420-dependent oxidoreductase